MFIRSLNQTLKSPIKFFMGTSGGVMVSKPTRVSSSLIGRPFHSALCHIEAKSFVNYYQILHVVYVDKQIVIQNTFF